MKSRSKNHRRIRSTAPRALFDAIEMLEARTMLSGGPVITISNGHTGAPVQGSLTVSVDPFGSFGESFPQSGALYDPFPFGDGNAYNSVNVSSLYFQPAGGFLTEGYVLSNQTAANAATNVQFTTPSVNTAISTFSLDGFDIKLTQVISDVPGSDSNTYLTQTYEITNVSNSTYNNVPFNVVHYLHAARTDASISNWAGLSGDERIGITFTDLNSDAVFQRIDALGLDESNNTVPDWDSPVGVAPNGASTSENGQYYTSIVAADGIPAADVGVVQGDTSGDLLDDTQLPAGQSLQAVVAVQDSLTIPMGQKITYITRTGWGDTGTDEAPSIYHLPGTFDISAVRPSAPENTNATVQITRTMGSLGHAVVYMNTNDWRGTATPGNADDPNADFQEYDDPQDTSGTGLPAVAVTLADGETSTGATSFTDNPTVAVFNDTKIEPSEFFFAQINDPQDNAKLAKGADPATPTLTTITIPANDEPSPFHFASTDPTTNQPVITSWTEGQPATIAVMRDADDGGNPNTGPYGNVSVNYTITGSGSNPATPGVDFVDNTPNSSLSGNNVYTGTLTFPAATADTIDQNQYQYINLQTLTDNLFEGPETFTITLQSSDPLLIASPSTFTGTILDSQTSGPVHLEFASESVAESAGSKSIHVIRSGETTGQVTIDYSVNGGSGPNDAIPGVDFTVPGAVLSGNSYTGSLTFPVGVTDLTIPIDLISTNLAEPNKTLTIVLSQPQNENIVGLLGSPTVETLTITNNNTPGEIYFLGGSTQSIAEGPDPITGTPYKIMTLQVTRDPNDGAEGAVSVHYSTVDGTALAGTDYQATTGTLSWADGETGPKDIQVKVYDDTTAPFPRTNKTFSVNLSDPTGGVALATPSSVVVTIVDNQQPGVNLSDSEYTAYEKDPSTGQPGTANIVVERDIANTDQSSESWSFTYSVIPGTGLPNVDYVAPASTTTTVNVDASQSTYTISIPILADDNNASDTNFTVRLTGATIGGAPALGSSTSATVTITNADADVALASSTYIATPGAGTVPIIINRTGRSDAAIIVGYTTADGAATAGTDYTATTGSVTIPAGQNQVTVNVPILTPSGSTLPTRSFQFKITSAVLADPTDDANRITVNYSTTPSTVSIAGKVSATNIQLETGKGNRVNRVVVTFSDPLNSTGVNNPYNYVLTTIGKKGAFNSQITLTNALYDSSTDSVTLYTKKTLSPNKLYQLAIRTDGGIVSMSNQPFFTGAPGGLGGTQVATFATGSKIKYTDPDGDIVTLQVKRGGSMQFVEGINGAYPSISVFGTTKTQLTGKLKTEGDGHTIIASINNPDGVQDLLLDNPLFSVE